MNIVEDISQCQRIIYKEYNTKDAGSLLLLNEFCAEFLTCCNKLHKVLVFDCQGKYEFVEIIFLCLNQITSCIKYLEKTIKIEQSSNVILPLTRQYFFDRILWCLARIKSILNSIKDDVFFTTTLDEVNFIDILDAALEYLVPYSNYDHDKALNKSNLKNEAISDSQKLRTAIDKVISQSLAFANVAKSNDKKIINTLCQKVLKDCIDFEKECSLLKDNENYLANENNIHLKAIIVENALYKLEDYINESIIKLIYHVFTEFNQNSVENIRKVIKNDPDDDCIDDLIADFDINIDQLMQIGLFAIAFAPNSQVKTTVRNCLASLESLDSYLIPSIYAQCNLHFTILEEHFIEEVERFKKAIQEIIETDAFTESFLNILNEIFYNKTLNTEIMSKVIEMANLLVAHIELNDLELNLKNKPDQYEKFKNFKLMVNECHAVVTCANQIDSERILKRFKIMKSCLKKFHISLNGGKNSDKEKVSDVFIKSEDLADSQKMFESFGISPTIKNILYQSKRERKNLTGSLIVQCSKQLDFSNETYSYKNSSEKRSIKKRLSLRTAMFKRQKNEETQRIHKIYTENSMNLGLTDILDQLTNLSSSFGNITLST